MRFPIVSRRRYEAELADVKEQANQLRERALKAEGIASTEVAARRTIVGQYSELYDQHERVIRRNQALCAELEAAQVGSGFDAAKAKRTAERIARLQRAVARARAEAAAAPTDDTAALVAQLELAQRARRSLDQQCRTLQSANEADARELLALRTDGAAS